MTLQTVLLAGGVGGAKMAEGLAAVSDPTHLTIIGNVADDAEFHGLWVSPDIDTITYTLAGLIDRDRGWGVRDETFRALGVFAQLGRETWMQLGDKDLALHIYRTHERRAGRRPTEVARDIARALGVAFDILLPTDDPIHTRVRTATGWLDFQEYFVREQCQPEVLEIAVSGGEAARPTPEALAAVARAGLIVFAPSNPLVSIRPILAVAELHAALRHCSAPIVAVSPIVGGKALKGPADRMLGSLGYPVDAGGVAAVYDGLLDGMVIDRVDGGAVQSLEAQGLRVCVADTVMTDAARKAKLAATVLEFGETCRKHAPQA